MQKDRVLIVGDSFALLDEDNRHWASIWAERQGLTSVHCAIPGGNHVNIVGKFYSSNYDMSSIAGVIYCVTDLLRSEGVDRTFEFNGKRCEPVIDTLLNMNTNDWKYLLSGEIEGTHQDFPQHHYTRSMLTNLREEQDMEFYKVSSLRWIIRANFNSMKLFLNDITSNDIPVCVVNTVWRQIEQDNIRDMLLWNSPSYRNVGSSPSSNHIDLDEAFYVADKFEVFRREHRWMIKK